MEKEYDIIIPDNDQIDYEQWIDGQGDFWIPIA